MEIRGDRECRDCGTRWSYFETGTVACPACGSIHSVGVGERAEHTDGVADLTLEDAAAVAAENDVRGAAELGAERAAEYVRTRGFVHAGRLLDLDGVYVAAQELRHVGVEIARSATVTDAEERYLIALLRGAPEGDRPEEVPGSSRGARGLAVAAATREYARELSRWAGESPPSGTADCLERLTTHRKRVEALDGEVPPSEAERLLDAVRALAEYVRGQRETLGAARDHLDSLR